MGVYPDFPADTLTPAQMRESIQTKGCVLIRRLLSPTLLASWRRRIENVYAYLDQEFNAGRLPEAVIMGGYRFGHFFPYVMDTPGGPHYQIFYDMVLHTKMRDLMHEFFGPEFALLLQNSLPRRQRAKELRDGVPFHQDASFVGAEFLSLNFWTPLMNCGVDAPALEVILDGRQEMMQPPHAGDNSKQPYEQIEITKEVLKREYDVSLFWHPALNMGDVFVFTNFTLHRTYHQPEMTKDRISMEIRCTRMVQGLEQISPALGTIRKGSDEMQTIRQGVAA